LHRRARHAIPRKAHLMFSAASDFELATLKLLKGIHISTSHGRSPVQMVAC
jgi:hypothetical protein